MRLQLRRVLCASSAILLFAALGVAMIPTTFAAASRSSAPLESQHVTRPQGAPAGCDVWELVSPAGGLSYTFTLNPGLPATVYAEVYEDASYNPVTEKITGCNYYFAHVKICAENGLGPNGAIWLYDSGGTYLASTPSDQTISGCSAWSGWTTTVYAATGVKAKLGAQIPLIGGYQTQYPFPSSGTYHL